MRPGLLVKGLIAINVVIFLMQQSDPSIVRDYGDFPLAVAAGEYYRLITAAFLHANFMHLLFNMGALFIFGSQIEALVGRPQFVGLYLLAALGGSTVSMLFQSPLVVGVGASGALFGLLGAFVVLGWAERVDVRSIIALIGINLLLGVIEPVIDNWAHLGGLIVGVVGGGVIVATRRMSPAAAARVQVVAAVAMVVVLALIVDARASEIRDTPLVRYFS